LSVGVTADTLLIVSFFIGDVDVGIGIGVGVGVFGIVAAVVVCAAAALYLSLSLCAAIKKNYFIHRKSEKQRERDARG